MNEAGIYLDDARRFQKNGEYEFAIILLEKARSVDYDKIYELEIEKLLGFNYRKLQKFDISLLHINNAIAIAKESKLENADVQYGICLMNRGILFEEQGEIDKALKSYLPALDVFTSLYDSSPTDFGIIINALLTIAMLYYNTQQYHKTKEYLERAMLYFENDINREKDRRYMSIKNTLEQIESFHS